MFTLLFFVIAATALCSGAPWLFSLALTAFLASIFPVVILLVIIAAVAVLAFNHYR
jgi:hypothetical protein